jgi:hypothetical protein
MFKNLMFVAAVTGLIAVALPADAPAATTEPLTCKDAAKLKYPKDRQMRVAYKRGCKKAAKLNPQPLPPEEKKS